MKKINLARENYRKLAKIASKSESMLESGEVLCEVTAASIIREAIKTIEQEGEVVVTKNQDGHIVCVTRQDEDGRILKIISESSGIPNLNCKSQQKRLATLWGYVKESC